MILLFPFAKQLRHGGPNPKSPPLDWWKELVNQITEPLIQIGVEGESQLVPDFRKNLSLSELANLVNECRTWIGVDSFGQHFCWDLGKPGIVIWGPSDPLIFGHPENTNLLKSRECLNNNQFLTWEEVEYNPTVFVNISEVISCL